MKIFLFFWEINNKILPNLTDYFNAEEKSTLFIVKSEKPTIFSISRYNFLAHKSYWLISNESYRKITCGEHKWIQRWNCWIQRHLPCLSVFNAIHVCVIWCCCDARTTSTMTTLIWRKYKKISHTQTPYTKMRKRQQEYQWRNFRMYRISSNRE